MSAPALLADAVPLSLERHRGHFLRTDAGFAAFGKLNAAPVLMDEFPALIHDYVIGFLKHGEGFAPVALLGLAESENLYLGAEGRWLAEYIPAVLRQQPFVAGRSKDGKSGLLCIAENFPGLNTAGQGTPLFEPDGRPGALVSRAQQFVAQVAQGAMRTESLCARLVELDLLAPVRTEMTRPDGAHRSIRGIHAVKREALDKLPAETLAALHKQGALEAIYLHLLSLRNFNSLANRIQSGHAGPVN